MMVGGWRRLGGVMAVYIALEPIDRALTTSVSRPCGLYLSRFLPEVEDRSLETGKVASQAAVNVIEAAAAGASDGMMLESTGGDADRVSSFIALSTTSCR